jgi:hypothetical protein
MLGAFAFGAEFPGHWAIVRIAGRAARNIALSLLHLVGMVRAGPGGPARTAELTPNSVGGRD